MQDRTRRLWDTQDQLGGDRQGLFTAGIAYTESPFAAVFEHVS